jgi:2-oxoglutarate ferredoxin oxidoreductase subunit gamma
MRVFSIPATRLAEELGRRMVLNIVMVGFFGAVTQCLHRDALRRAVAASVPRDYTELNLRAFDRGWEYGAAQYAPHPTIPEIDPAEIARQA